MHVSLRQARELLLACQGLGALPAQPARKADVLAAVRRMQLLQIDTISVVARSPYFVLYSRIGSYEQRWLDELHAGGKLTEHWAHAACFFPMEDYPLFAGLIQHGARRSLPGWHAWAARHQREVEHVRKRLATEGALKSSDFVNEEKRGTWWDWKIEKEVLECLLALGELMVARREGFQRVYDLRERVLPGWDESQLLAPTEIYRRMVSKSALALGVATEPWLRDYYRLYQKDTRQAIAVLLDSGELMEVQLEGTREPAYVHRDNRSLLSKAQRGGLAQERTELLSPFDPVVWHRERAAALFGFDYLIECYTLEHKRRYGYFTLPILHNGALIGRLDPKAHRRDGVFEVKSLHFEPGVRLSEEDWQALARAIHNCAAWHITPKVKVTGTKPAPGAAALRRAIRELE